MPVDAKIYKSYVQVMKGGQHFKLWQAKADDVQTWSGYR